MWLSSRCRDLAGFHQLLDMVNPFVFRPFEFIMAQPDVSVCSKEFFGSAAHVPARPEVGKGSSNLSEVGATAPSVRTGIPGIFDLTA